MHKDETWLVQISFYSGAETFDKMNYNDDDVKNNCGRVETFEIAGDEQLIGCELYSGNKESDSRDVFNGVAWFKCKIAKLKRVKNYV